MIEYMRAFDGIKIYTNSEVSPEDRAVVLIVHGLCEHQGRYDAAVHELHKQGIGTYRFDHRGHGRSGGERTYLDDYTDMLQDIDMLVKRARKEHPRKPLFLLGHSMGGLVSALYGAVYPNKEISGIIISGGITHDSLGSISKKAKECSDPHQRFTNKMGAGLCTVREVVERYGNDPYNADSIAGGMYQSMNRGILWFKENVQSFTYPVLMLHGEEDSIVSPKDTQWLFRRVASVDKQIKLYSGLRHEILQEYCRNDVIKDVITWVQNRL